ncbi:MAG TPA: DUF222 domain-containing protein [Actinomycetes bacterium]|nr:DUF222 domain-containing protein [Actinomycetes bacterium]
MVIEQMFYRGIAADGELAMRVRDVGVVPAGSTGAARRSGGIAELDAPDLFPLASLPPGAALACALETIDPAGVSDFALVDVIAGCERLSAWASAVQAAAIAELAGRAVFDGRRIQARRLAGMEVSARLRLSPSTGEHRVVVAQTLALTLPATLGALHDGVIDYRRAVVLAEAALGLSAEQARRVEALTLPQAGQRTLSRHRAAVERAVLEVDPRGAAEQHELAAAGRRVDFFAQPAGMGSVTALLPADGMAAVRAVLDAAATAMKADRPDDPRTVDQRRADALVHLAQTSLDSGRLAGAAGGQRLAHTHGRRANVQVTVPYSTLIGLDEQPGELAGYGPIPAEIARRVAAEGTWRRLLTDPASGALLDHGSTRYRPPQDLIDHVIARDRTCVFVGCAQPAWRCQLDHTIPAPGGPTSEGNIGPMCGPHHDGKTHGGWDVDQPQPGRFHWTSPTGHTYTVEPRAIGPIIEPAPNSADPPELDDPPETDQPLQSDHPSQIDQPLGGDHLPDTGDP